MPTTITTTATATTEDNLQAACDKLGHRLLKHCPHCRADVATYRDSDGDIVCERCGSPDVALRNDNFQPGTPVVLATNGVRATVVRNNRNGIASVRWETGGFGEVPNHHLRRR